MAELLPALARRRARRAFSARAVPGDELNLLWQAVLVAPSHGNTQPVHILLPENTAQRESLTATLSDGNRPWASNAPVLCALSVLPGLERTVTDRDGAEREM